MNNLTNYITGLGINLEGDMGKTPDRMDKAMRYLCRYLRPESKEEIEGLLSKKFPINYKGMVVQNPIKTYSLCSHHLLPVEYTIALGYVPDKLSLGFSKSIRLIELLAAQPVSQEDLTQLIAETLMKYLKPKGLMLILKGIHHCMKIREIKCNTANITSAVRGTFKKDEKTRSEFLSLVDFGNGN